MLPVILSYSINFYKIMVIAAEVHCISAISSTPGYIPLGAEIKEMCKDPSSFRGDEINRYSKPLNTHIYPPSKISLKGDYSAWSSETNAESDPTSVIVGILRATGEHIGKDMPLLDAMRRLPTETIDTYIYAFHECIERQAAPDYRVFISPMAIDIGIQLDYQRAAERLQDLEKNSAQRDDADKIVYAQLSELLNTANLDSKTTSMKSDMQVTNYAKYRAQFLHETAKYPMSDQARMDMKIGEEVWRYIAATASNTTGSAHTHTDFIM
jgi:hypothetical protein